MLRVASPCYLSPAGSYLTPPLLATTLNPTHSEEVRITLNQAPLAKTVGNSGVFEVTTCQPSLTRRGRRAREPTPCMPRKVHCLEVDEAVTAGAWFGPFRLNFSEQSCLARYLCLTSSKHRRGFVQPRSSSRLRFWTILETPALSALRAQPNLRAEECQLQLQDNRSYTVSRWY